MRKIIPIFVLLSIVSVGLAQTDCNFQIQNKTTAKPISYVTVLNKNTNTGTYTDENGCFVVDLQKADSIIVSCIGFETLEISLKANNQEKIIFLNPIVYCINEVEIKATTEPQNRKHLGYDKYKYDLTISNAPGATFVSYIPNQEHLNLVIEEIIIPTKKRNAISKRNNINDGFFRIHLFSVDQNTKKPDKELLTKNEIFNTSDFSNQKIKIDISEQNILLPEDGVFVGIEWLGDNENTERHGWMPFLVFTMEISNPLTWTKDILTNNDWELVDGNKWSQHSEGVINATFGISVKQAD